MITFIKHKFNKKGDTLPRIVNEKNENNEKFDMNVKFNIIEKNDINEKNEDDNIKLNNRKSLYETQKALRKSYSNPNFKDFPDTKVNVKDATNHDKIEFLKEFSLDYGYNGKIDAIRKNEYPHLKGAVYLDHSGSTTYAKSVLTAVCNDLTQNLFGNPHSDNPSSSLSSHRVMQTRLRILKHFDASPDDFEVVFTQNATAALKLVGETFPWVAGRSSFKYLRESHNSLLGIRSLAEAAGLKDISLVLESEIEDLIKQKNNQTNYSVDDDNDYYDDDDDDDEITYSLFAYPAQCNFSGQRFPLNWPRRLKKKLDTQKSKLLVLMDAAAYAMTATLSLANKETSPDFMAVSFYKMFGYPTGLGALIVKKELFPIMRKKYFGGGSVRAVAFDRPWQRFNPSISEKFEDGTINFLDIIALHHSFTVHEQIYIDYRRIKPHVTSLIIYLTRRMQSFVHWNGLPVCEIYTEREFTDNSRQGPVLNFNVRRADGSWVGTAEVERMASANGIHIRVGGHCNPGCIAKWVNITVDDIMETYAKYGMVCGNGVDYIKEKPAGGVRISLGAMTTIDDILAWLHFFKSYYVEDAPPVNIARQSVHQQLSPVSRKRSLRNSRSMHQLAPILQTSQISPDDSKHDVESDSEITSDIEDVPPKQSVHQQFTPIKKMNSLRNARSMHQLNQTPQTSQISPDSNTHEVSIVHSDTNETSKISSFIEDVPSYNPVKNGHSLRNMHQLTQTSQISPDSNTHDVSIVHSDTKSRTSNMNETSKISSFIEDVPPYNLVKQSVHQQPSSPTKIGRNLRSMHQLTQTSQISPDNYTNDFSYDTKSSKLSSFNEGVPPYNLVKQSVHQQPSPQTIGHGLRNVRSMQQLTPILPVPQISPNGSTHDANSNSFKLKTLKTIKNQSDRIYHSPELSKKSSVYLINRAYL